MEKITDLLKEAIQLIKEQVELEDSPIYEDIQLQYNMQNFLIKIEREDINNGNKRNLCGNKEI